MNVRRRATLAASAGVLVAGLAVAAPAATANNAAPKEKCDPAAGMRVAYSTSGDEKVEARGCVQFTQLDNGQWTVTGAVRAKATTAHERNWRLVKHPYQRSCTVNRTPLLAGKTMVEAKNSTSVSVDGRTDGPCLRTTLRPGSYVFTWTYERQADRPESTVTTEGEVTVTLPSSGSILVRPMPQL